MKAYKKTTIKYQQVYVRGFGNIIRTIFSYSELENEQYGFIIFENKRISVKRKKHDLTWDIL